MIAEALAFGAAGAAAAAVLSLAPTARRRDGGGPPFVLLARVGRVLLPRGALALTDLDRRLLEAGRPGGMRARDLLASKVAAALAAGACGVMVGAILPGRLGLLAAVVSPAGGFLAPDWWLSRRRRERLTRARRDLPVLLDLLRVSVEAGASLPEGLADVGRRSHAPVARLWAAIAAQVAVGVPLQAALERHRRELPMPEIESFATALGRAVRHGAPLSDTLAAQARDARLSRRRAIQEEAARAGPKMQLVVALLLVPSVMLLVAAALLSALMDEGPGAVLGF